MRDFARRSDNEINFHWDRIFGLGSDGLGGCDFTDLSVAATLGLLRSQKLMLDVGRLENAAINGIIENNLKVLYNAKLTFLRF